MTGLATSANSGTSSDAPSFLLAVALEFNILTTGSSVNLTSFEPRDSDQTKLEYITELEMRRRERENLFAVLQKTSWKIKGVDGAAELLGIKPSTLISRMEKMGLKRPA